jgi:hypothetical protein
VSTHLCSFEVAQPSQQGWSSGNMRAAPLDACTAAYTVHRQVLPPAVVQRAVRQFACSSSSSSTPDQGAASSHTFTYT